MRGPGFKPRHLQPMPLLSVASGHTNLRCRYPDFIPHLQTDVKVFRVRGSVFFSPGHHHWSPRTVVTPGDWRFMAVPDAAKVAETASAGTLLLPAESRGQTLSTEGRVRPAMTRAGPSTDSSRPLPIIKIRVKLTIPNSCRVRFGT